MALKRLIFLGISFLIIASIVLYSNPALLVSELARVNFTFIALGLMISTISIIFRVLKWNVLIKDVSFTELFPVQTLGITISNFTPGKIAEPVKAILLKLRKGVPVSVSLHSIIWERIFDLTVAILMSLMAVHLLASNSKFFFIGFLSIGIFVFLIALLFVILYNKKIGMKVFRLVTKLPVLNRLKENFMTAFYENRLKTTSLIKSFLLTIVPWLLEGVIFYFAFLSLGIETSPFVLSGIIVLSVLIGLVSMLPGGLGSTEFVMIILLELIGLRGTTAITGMLIYRFMSFWYGAFIGGLSFIYLSRKIDLKNIKLN